MTGPVPFPPPGSNAIGSFAIGVSSIGTIPQFDYQTTIVAQYANSPVITQLLNFMFQWFDPTERLDNFYDQVWNVLTAEGWGLDVWGRIVGVSRTLKILTGKFFGFKEGGVIDYDVFGPGGASPFYAGSASTQNYDLTDEAYRQLILAKAAANISDCSIPSINNILMTLFGMSGTCYVTDGGNMTMTYTFKFQPTAVQLAIIEQSGVLPKPVGVAASVVISP